MKRLLKSILSLALAATLTVGMFGGVAVSADEQELTSEQMNAIAIVI